MRFSVYQVSRKGGRDKNEDRMGYCYTRDSGLFALADGMGGHPEGEVASQLALQTLASIFQRDARPVLKDPARYLNDGILAAHHTLLRYATEKALLDTPRTTVVACIMQGNAAYWAHCGDSRLYLIRGDKLISRTRDHSYSELQEAMTGGGPAAERVNRNVLFTCLGSPGKPVIDSVGPLIMRPGDRVMLCSDGLWGTVGDEDITRALASRPLAHAVPDLVEQALRSGGPRADNVTVLAVEWDGLQHTRDNDIRTEELDEEGFASTIQPGSGPGTGTDKSDGSGGTLGTLNEDELDEAEIDRSIREINEAIRRSSVARPGRSK